MTKYIKHYYVDGTDLTTFLTDTNIGKDGKTHPRIDGLDVKFWFIDNNGIDYCLSVIPESTTITQVTGLEEMAYNDWANEVEIHFNNRKLEVSNDALLLERVNMTSEEAMALVLNKDSVEAMLLSFQSLEPLLPNP